MTLFLEWPLLAALPAVVFLGLYRSLQRRSLLVAGLAWLVYAGYELGMRRRWLCTGECNIRVDLILIYPVLAVVSLVGLVAVTRGRSHGPP